MYSDYKQVKKFFTCAEELLKSRKTLQEIFLAATSQHKKETAITYINEKDKIVSYKYKQYRSFCFEYASRISSQLHEIPFKSVVGLKVKNCPEWPLLFWGLLMSGFVPFLIDTKLPKENTENLLKQSCAAAIITDEIFSYSLPSINVSSLKDVKVDFKFAEKWADKVIFCSSGTTGNVKLMVFTGSNLCHQIAACLEMPESNGDIAYPGEINIIALVPFHHIFGFVAVFLWYTFFGKNIVFVKDLSPKVIMSTSQRCSVTHVYSVPLFWDSLAQTVVRKSELEGDRKSEILDKMIAYNTGKISSSEAGSSSSVVVMNSIKNQLLGRKIRFCISGGGYISPETLNIINGIGYPLYNGYGMTEAGVTSVELASKVEYRLKGSIGKPLYGVEYKLVDTKTLSPNTGELLIKSEYLHSLEIVDGVEQKPVLENGFLRTGDIAEVDESGFYYVKGRIKDIIINENGENIYPDELESYFIEIPGITNCCALGISKGKSEHETITLVIEIANDVDEEKLQTIKDKVNEINNKLTNEKRIKDFWIAKDKLPLTSSLKVKRFRVKELLKIKQSAFVGFNDKKTIKTFEGYKKEDVEPIVKNVRKIFAKTLFLPIVKVGDDDHWINDLGGDSMSYIELINEINKYFEVEIPQEKYALLTSVNEFVEQILVMKQVKKAK